MRRHAGELGKGPVVFGPDGANGDGVVVRGFGLAGRAGDARPQRRARDPGAQADHAPAQIAALDARKGQRPGPAARIGDGIARGAGHRAVVPAQPRVDVGVVHPRRQNLHQHLARAGARHGQAVGPAQHLGPAVRGQLDAAHGGGQAHVRRSGARPHAGGARFQQCARAPSRSSRRRCWRPAQPSPWRNRHSVRASSRGGF